MNVHVVPLTTDPSDGQSVDISGAVNAGTVHGSAIGKIKFKNHGRMQWRLTILSDRSQISTE